jgi:hypothetical protein
MHTPQTSTSTSPLETLPSIDGAERLTQILAEDHDFWLLRQTLQIYSELVRTHE